MLQEKSRFLALFERGVGWGGRAVYKREYLMIIRANFC